MFSGEDSINEINNGIGEFAPWILIISGLLKLVITNVCIKSGWKGGHFFPVIFCGVSIGFGVALLMGLDTAFLRSSNYRSTSRCYNAKTSCSNRTSPTLLRRKNSSMDFCLRLFLSSLVVGKLLNKKINIKTNK